MIQESLQPHLLFQWPSLLVSISLPLPFQPAIWPLFGLSSLVETLAIMLYRTPLCLGCPHPLAKD